MMYRPKNWAELKKLGDKELNDENYLDNVFEAGADAMLEALLNSEPRHRILPQDNDDLSNLYPGQTGWLVFIPDKQVKKDD